MAKAGDGETRARPLREVAAYFARLGIVAFGGPAAHVAMMRRDLVERRGWVTDAEFVDLLGAVNLIPGPNSTELTMHLGARRAGWAGLYVGGLAFIGPAVAIVLALAVAYEQWGATTGGEAILAGVQPVVLAIVVQAIWGLRRAAVKGPATLVVVAVVAGLAVAGTSEIALILGAGLTLAFGWLALRSWRRLRRTRAGSHHGHLGLLLATGTMPKAHDAWELFLVFLKIGAVLYGSGYVLFSFMQDELVDARGWLTQQQLLDAIAVGQFTPGPLFSSATFAGYVVDGWRGAALATLGIFVPSFFFVTVTHPILPWLRRTPWAAPFLDGVNAAAIALMAVVTVTLARDALDGPFAISLFSVAAIVLVRFSPNTALVVLAGVAAGLLRAAVV